MLALFGEAFPSGAMHTILFISILTGTHALELSITTVLFVLDEKPLPLIVSIVPPYMLPTWGLIEFILGKPVMNISFLVGEFPSAFLSVKNY
jgi:hypothetical protein